jgi:hypothetical protein
MTAEGDTTMADHEQPLDWEVVWEQTGLESEMDADLVVSLLEGSSIPVVRIPPSNAPSVFDGLGGPMLPVQVLVPPDRAADARELVEGAGIGVETEELEPGE